MDRTVINGPIARDAPKFIVFAHRPLASNPEVFVMSLPNRASSACRVALAAFTLGLAALGCGGERDGAEVSSPAVSEAAAPLLTPAPDANVSGPRTVTAVDYQFAPAVDPDVLTDRATELWARVYLPSAGGAPRPVIVAMHGNSPTCGVAPEMTVAGDCGYTNTGVCSGANPVVLQNHLGFDYFAQKLASWGYVVVSVNTNRGISCGASFTGDNGLNLARGRMILKHLSLLHTWNTTPGTTPASLGVDLFGTLNLTRIGLLGHSRAGEGVRAALEQYRDVGSPWPAKIPGLGIQSIFEIGGNDGQTSRTLNAVGTFWHQLLPACDGPNRTFSGMKPFDRMLTQPSDLNRMKSYSVVWNANHNGYNSFWQISDSLGCSGTYWTETPLFSASGPVPAQQTNGSQLVLAFFRGSLPTPVAGGYSAAFLQKFDPMYGLGSEITSVTNVNRSYIASGLPSSQAKLDDFLNTQGDTSSGVTATLSGITDHSPTQRAMAISWTSAGSGNYFQSTWANPGTGTDMSGDLSLDFRVSRDANALNVKDVPTDFAIQLLDSTGALSTPVRLATYTTLGGPPGTLFTGLGGVPSNYYHRALRTVRVPLCDFSGVNMAAIRGVRFTFDTTPTGAIFLANLRRKVGGAASCIPTSPVPPPGQGSAGVDVAMPDPAEALGNEMVIAQGNQLLGAERVRFAEPELGRGLLVTVRSESAFPVTQELAALDLGGELVTDSFYPEPTDLRTLSFRVAEEQLSRIGGTLPVSVRYGTEGASPVRFALGELDVDPLLD
jgi:hypothetical protein